MSVSKLNDSLISQDVDLTSLNTFGLTSVARYYARPRNIDQLRSVCEYADKNALPLLILGGGSNILFKTSVFNGLVVHLNLEGIEIQPVPNGFFISAGASENWHQFVQTCIRQGIVGLENLSLIPGSVGASPVQNIGAYGVEVGDYIQSVECFDPVSLSCVTLSNDQCRFGYRDSIFKHESSHYIILNVRFFIPKNVPFKLSYGDVEARVNNSVADGAEMGAALVSQVISSLRSEKLPDPELLGNAGSFFKNPVVSAAKLEKIKSAYPNVVAYPYQENYKLAAGWMIDQLNFKGFSVGGAAVHDKQALVLVNKDGNAKAEDLFALVELIHKAVLESFGVSLEVEPVIIN